MRILILTLMTLLKSGFVFANEPLPIKISKDKQVHKAPTQTMPLLIDRVPTQQPPETPPQSSQPVVLKANAAAPAEPAQFNPATEASAVKATTPTTPVAPINPPVTQIQTTTDIPALTAQTVQTTQTVQPAQTVQPRQSVQPEIDLPTPGRTTLSGMVDVYYSYNFGRPSQRNVMADPNYAVKTYPNATNRYRYYDFYHDQLSLSWAQLSVQHTQGDVSAQIDFDYGTAADRNALAGYADSDAAASTATDLVSKNIGQAFFVYKPTSLPRLFVRAGKMYTHMRFEQPRAKDNWNYSHSFLYGYGLPFWHTGAAIGYEWLPNEFTTTFYIYNGWNNFYDNNAAKSFGAQLKWVIAPDYTFIYNVLRGPEKWLNERDIKEVHEFNFVWAASESLSFAVEGMFGWEANVQVASDQERKRAEWWAGLLFAKHQPVKWYYTAFRFEHFQDVHGWIFATEANPERQSLQSYTLTNSFQVAQHVQMQLETRHDVGTRESKFYTAGGTSRAQLTMLLSGIYSF